MYVDWNYFITLLAGSVLLLGGMGGFMWGAMRFLDWLDDNVHHGFTIGVIIIATMLLSVLCFMASLKGE